MAAKMPPVSGSTHAASVSMKDYLKRYQSGPAAADPKKAKKKKKPKPSAVGCGVLIVDEDPVWQKPVQIEEDEPAPSGDEMPQVDEDIEVKRMRRMEAIRAARPYNSIADDGSGWVTLPVPEATSDRSQNNTPSPQLGVARVTDLSPPRRRQRRDTPSPEQVGISEKELLPARQRQRQRRRDTPSPEGNDVTEQGDMSPPRKFRPQHDPSPPRRRARHDSEDPQDLSPPQRRMRHDSEEPQELPLRRKARHDSEDLSPPRRQTTHDAKEPKDISPPWRRTRHDSEEPQDLSLRRKARHDSDDLSPPRRRTRHAAKEPKDISPPRRRTRHDSEEPQDLSKPRKACHDSEDPEDLSPPRRRPRHDAKEPKDISPPRRRTRHDSEEPLELSTRRRPVRFSSNELKDLSSPRRKKYHDSTKLDDLSPPRRQNFGQHLGDGDISPPRKGKKIALDDLSPPRKSRKGASKEVRKAGLMSAAEVKEDIRKIKEDEMLKFTAQDPSFTGKGAKAVFRDKDGKQINEEDIQKAREKEKPKEKHIEWGKGLVQKRAAQARVQELEDEKSKPFARTRDDPELDSMLKNRIRWGDPMAHLVKRKDTDILLDDLGDDEKMKESGFIVPQNIPAHSWLKRGVDPPPNRYGIKPGRHWDGVDRSNGFEKDMYKLKNDKQANEQEAYLWSVADM